MADVNEEEDLDYHITFPSNVCQVSEEDGDDIDEQQQEPVVVLLGWVGCQDKHLAKYSSFYEKRCITIRYTAAHGDVFYRPNNLRNIAAKILELLDELSLEENPVFFHVFSNGGCFVYGHLTKLIHETPEYQHIRMQGAIFDSCPADTKPYVAAKAFFSSARNLNIVFRYVAAFFFLLFFYFQYLTQYCKKFVSNNKEKTYSVDFMEKMMNDKSSCPQLFLYSTADKVVCSIGIEELIKHRESKGVIVRSVRWEDSGHVQHFRHHRESYINQCTDFVDFCLGFNQNDNVN